MKALSAAAIRKRRCYRCGQPGYATWCVCADANRRRIVCRRCDVALNRLVLRWMRDPRWRRKLARYEAKVLR